MRVQNDTSRTVGASPKLQPVLDRLEGGPLVAAAIHVRRLSAQIHGLGLLDKCRGGTDAAIGCGHQPSQAFDGIVGGSQELQTTVRFSFVVTQRPHVQVRLQLKGQKLTVTDVKVVRHLRKDERVIFDGVQSHLHAQLGPEGALRQPDVRLEHCHRRQIRRGRHDEYAKNMHQNSAL